MFHDLRPTFATTALQNGVDVKTVFPFWDTTTPGLPCAPAPIPRGKNRAKWPIPLSLACILRSAARKRAYYLLFETFLSLSLLLVVSRFFRTLVCKLWHEWSQPAMEASSMAASRCFIFMYFLLPHWEPATWRSRAQTSIRAELPSGKLPTTRVRRRISRFSLSMT